MESNNEFKIGQLIIPNGIVESGFYYERGVHLYDDVEYKVADNGEFIYYKKYIESGMSLTDDINKYMEKGNKISSDHNKSRQDELNRFSELNTALNRRS